MVTKAANSNDAAILVSVIVPTYRRKESLYRALLSLTHQTYPNIEVIVVNDNADRQWTAEVQQIIDRIQLSCPALQITHIINSSNMGSAQTRNTGIRAASGSYITFLDDDDVYLPDKVDRQLHDMIAIGADYGITDLRLYNAKEKLIDVRQRTYIQATDGESLLRYHMMYHMTGTDTLMFKKSYLETIGLFPPIDVGDEFYLIEKAILQGGVFRYSDHCHVKAYVHEEDQEGISLSERKIIGENALYQAKKKYFPRFSRQDVRYIKVRHHMVIAFAQIRRKNWKSVLKHGALALLISPVSAIRILITRS